MYVQSYRKTLILKNLLSQIRIEKKKETYRTDVYHLRRYPHFFLKDIKKVSLHVMRNYTSVYTLFPLVENLHSCYSHIGVVDLIIDRVSSSNYL